MIRVKLSVSLPTWPLLRQTPGGCGKWGGCEFLINQNVNECDYWVVIDDLPKVESTKCAPANTIFINCEPPTVRSYRQRFLTQFATIVSCQGGRLDHPNVVYGQPGLRWGIGVQIVDGKHQSFMNYDQIRDMPRVRKTKLLSVITSNKDMTRGHRQRINFAHRLKEYFGDQLDIFGFGINELNDKLDGIAEYKYHIVIENSSYCDYWTEKLADAYLSRSYPFYAGCPNLEEYFPSACFTRINLSNFEQTVSIIKNAIAFGQYERSELALARARDLVLKKYNVFQMLAERCGPTEKKLPQEPLTLLPWRLLEPRRAVLAQEVRNKVLYSWRGQQLLKSIRNLLPDNHT